MLNPNIIREIRDGEKQDWDVSINQEPIQNVKSVHMENRNIGIAVDYGMLTHGYDSIVVTEIGGANIAPYCIMEETLHIGVLRQLRYNMGGWVLNIPRGFMNLNENHFQAAVRENQEETRFNFTNLKRIKQLSHAPQNQDSGYFNTVDGKGIQTFSLLISPTELEQTTDLNWCSGTIYQFKPEVLKPISSIAEKIMGCKFIPWREAMKLADMPTTNATGMLIATLFFPP